MMKRFIPYITALISILIIMQIYNHLFTDLFNLRLINYWESFLLFVFCKLLFPNTLFSGVLKFNNDEERKLTEEQFNELQSKIDNYQKQLDDFGVELNKVNTKPDIILKEEFAGEENNNYIKDIKTSEPIGRVFDWISVDFDLPDLDKTVIVRFEYLGFKTHHFTITSRILFQQTIDWNIETINPKKILEWAYITNDNIHLVNDYIKKSNYNDLENVEDFSNPND